MCVQNIFCYYASDECCKNGLFGSKYKMSMMAVCTSMRKFVSEYAKLTQLDRKIEERRTICVMKNEMRTVAVQNFHIFD